MPLTYRDKGTLELLCFPEDSVGSKPSKGPAHQTDSSHSCLGRRLRQVAGGPECWGGIWMGVEVGRDLRLLEGGCVTATACLLINFPQGKA